MSQVPVRPVPAFLAPFVKLHEGFVPRAAPDPAGFATLGYGHKIGPTDPLQSAVLDEAQASLVLADDLNAEATMFCAVTPTRFLNMLADYQYAALVDFVFNEGIGEYRTSHLRQLVEGAVWAQVPAELGRWVFSKGRILPGLVSRRRDEAAMWQGLYPGCRPQ